MAKEQMSVSQYADLRGIKRQAVLKQIKFGREMPGVTSYRKVGSQYVLTVDRKKITQ